MEAENALAAAAEVKWLVPATLRARFDPESSRLQLQLGPDEEIADARAARAFPVSDPGGYIEFTGPDGQPVGMLRALADLEAGSRGAVEAALRGRYLIPRIERVLELAEIAPFVMRWRVRTDRGELRFHTEGSREALRQQEPDYVCITDLAGSQYCIPSVAALDAASRARLAEVL